MQGATAGKIRSHWWSRGCWWVPGSYGDVNQADVAPTLAALLGTNIPASAQGRARTEMLTLSAEQKAAVERASAAQQAVLAQAYGKAIGHPVSVAQGADVVAATQSAMDAALTARLRTERLPRAIIAIVLALIPAGILLLRRGWTMAWLLAGALLYVVLFNVRYAVLAGRTYSLSSITSSGDFTSLVLLSALVAFALSWLLPAFGLRIFRRGPGSAARLTVALALTTVYLLLLPILWSFAVNGLFVTWALPDFGSMFVALLSGIQALIVAAGGVILCGVAALIARLAFRPGTRR